MRLLILLALLAAAPLTGARADQALTDTTAFEQAEALSFYGFDACGDGLGGRLYRRALVDRFAQCPFAAASRARFAQRVRAQQRKSREMLDHLIEDHGGLPVQLEGMNRTCHEQSASPEYQRLHGVLEQYAAGAVPADAVVTAPCDAASLVP